MAESQLVMTLTWENEASFKMRSKKDDNPDVLILEFDENKHIMDTWPYIEKVCLLYFGKKIEEIGNEMKK